MSIFEQLFDMLFISLSLSWVLLPIFWFVRELKAINLWLYVWQLKEYHVGRFKDHFHTYRGQRLIFNNIVYIKLALLAAFLLFSWILRLESVQSQLELRESNMLRNVLFAFTALFGVVLLLYAFEAAKAVSAFIQKTAIQPVATKKIIVLRLAVTLLTIFFIAFPFIAALVVPSYNKSFEWVFNFYALPTVPFLLYDLLTPIIVSAVVLAFQPFAALARNRVIRQASKRRKEFSAQGGSAPGGKNLKVVGITGSYGKTSTKEFLAHILGQKYHVLKTPEHMNSEMGIAQTILRSLTDEHDVFVCEMGAYNKGGIKLLASIAKPDIGIVTGVNEQHLAMFGSMENLLSAEGGRELVEALPENGCIILNGSNEYCWKLYQEIKKPKKILCIVISAAAPNRILAKSDIRAENLLVGKERISFEVDGIDFRVPVYGGHNVQNLLLAIAAAKELGMRLEEIAKALESMPLELSALKVKKAANGATIIDSTYSANPDGVIADLDYLNLYEGKKVIVMPCLIELGKASSEAHFRIGEKIAEVCNLAIITTRDRLNDIKEGATNRGMPEGSIVFIENKEEIIKKVKSTTGANDVVLLEGRGPVKAHTR